MVFSKFKLPLRRRQGRCEKEREDSLVNKSSIGKEYMKTIRAGSYTDMLTKMQNQMGRKSLGRRASSSSLPSHVHLFDHLLEPPQETLIDMIEGSNIHPLFVDYFMASVEACNLCELLLRGVHQARADHDEFIKTVIQLTQSTPEPADYKDAQCHAVREELARFAVLKNSLLVSQFYHVQDSHGYVLHRLMTKLRNVRKSVKFTRFFKKSAGYSLLVSFGLLALSLLALEIHSVVGIVAVPALVAGSLLLIKKGYKLIKRGLDTGSSERLGAQLEVTAKGVYTWIKGFETMRPLLRRLQDEIEHSRAIANICVRNGKRGVLKEVVRKYQIDKAYYMELLDELEEQILLCFHNINKSRRLAMLEIVVLQQRR